jgi:hypothetical protein
MGDEGQILFTEPLFTPKVMLRSVCSVWSGFVCSGLVGL